MDNNYHRLLERIIAAVEADSARTDRCQADVDRIERTLRNELRSVTNRLNSMDRRLTSINGQLNRMRSQTMMESADTGGLRHEVDAIQNRIDSLDSDVRRHADAARADIERPFPARTSDPTLRAELKDIWDRIQAHDTHIASDPEGKLTDALLADREAGP